MTAPLGIKMTTNLHKAIFCSCEKRRLVCLNLINVTQYNILIC